MKIIYLVFFAFFIWCILCSYIYVYKIRREVIIKDNKIIIHASKKIKRKVNFEKINNDLLISIDFKDNSIIPDQIKNNDSLINIAYKYQHETGKKLLIKGFVNMQEDDNSEYKLGRIRAWVIKKKLIDKGITSEILITSAQINSKKNSVEITSE
ncbi:MAG: hypothetical protein IT243_05885 [Bacteroidia bacterium]|nr:hypothetical protein [Bacteroidia bacterium]